MEELVEEIKEKGIAIGNEILKVDSFLNHQVDVKLMKKIGKEFSEYFKNKNVTKVVTIESSGIAPATMTALELDVPLLILKKKKPNTMEDEFIQTIVKSFTKGNEYKLTVSKKYIDQNDNVIIIDDFLANGESCLGAIRLVEELGAKVQGIGIVIEKSFQPGREKIDKRGYDIYSLARIKKLENGKIEM